MTEGKEAYAKYVLHALYESNVHPEIDGLAVISDSDDGQKPHKSLAVESHFVSTTPKPWTAPSISPTHSPSPRPSFSTNH
ncbi:hypothetical protein AB1N83_012062 [Pleurotus pulmonarius]